MDARAYADREYAEDLRLLWLFSLVLIGLSVGYTGIAVINTMAMAARSRRTDHGVLARAGATRSQILRTVAAEASLVVGIGTALGLAVTLPPLAGMCAGLAEETGTPVALHLPPGVDECVCRGYRRGSALPWQVIGGRRWRARLSGRGTGDAQSVC